MSLPKAELLYSAQEYLALEREAFERHEWLDGFIYAMAGETPTDNLIGTNTTITLALQLRGKPCAVYSPNMNVYSLLATDVGLKVCSRIPTALSFAPGPVSRRASGCAS